MGAGQVRSAHEPRQEEHAARAPAGLRARERQERDVHRRGPDLVLERLRGRHADGRQGQLLRSPARHRRQDDAGPGDAEARGAPPAISTASQTPPPPAGSFDAAAADRGRPSSTKACASCHVGGIGTDNNDGKLHAAAETGHGWRLRRAHGEQEVPHDAASRALAAPAVLPRRKRQDAARRRQPLQSRARA